VRRWWLAIGLVVLASRTSCPHRDELRVATFNIEDFPKDDRQVAGALDEMVATGASVIGVQEISSAHVLLAGARARLGDSWQYVDDGAQRWALGVLYDGARWTLRSRRVHDDTRVDGRNKGVLDVRLAPAGGGEVLRVLVVHLKSGTSGRPTRARQYEGLARIAAEARASGDRVVILGDFNATEAADRDDLARLAATTGLTWASEPLACTAFWSRDDGCPRSRLDHVLTWTPPARITAAGACASEGCDWQASCPLYADQVSDHCPVVVTFETR
jgi:endonuclease/exonuclease/phosphatase family metal-dependent hydrolase